MSLFSDKHIMQDIESREIIVSLLLCLQHSSKVMKKSLFVTAALNFTVSLVSGQVALQVDAQPSATGSYQHPVLKNDLSHLPDLSVSQEKELRLIFKERAMEEARIRDEIKKVASSMDEGRSSETSSSSLHALKEDLHQNARRCDERVSAVLTAAQMAIYRERGQRWEID
jgi:hypothetical protein